MKYYSSVTYLKKLSIVFLIILLVTGFFIVPHLFPSETIAASMSYDYGCNNKFGVIYVVFAILIMVIWGFWTKMDAFALFSEDSFRISLSNLYIGAGLVVAFICITALSGERLVCYGLDCSYFIPRICEMKCGNIPYVDFAFFYGPLTIYVPYWINTLIPFLSVTNAYLLSVLIFHLLGLYMFFELVNGLETDKKVKLWVFWIVFVLFIPTTLGMNCQLLRFVFPFWMLWRLHYIRQKWIIFLSPLSVTFALGMSPEIGLVYFIVLVIYCLLQCISAKKKDYIYILFLTFITNVSFICLFSPMFSFLRASGEGYMNLPFVPSLHLIVFFLCVLIIAFYQGGAIRRIRNFPLEISFSIMSLGVIPACLGQTEPGNVIRYGFFIFIVGFIILLRFKPRLKTYILCIAIMVALPYFIWQIRFHYYSYIINIPYNNISIVYKYKNIVVKCLSLFGFSSEHVENKIESVYKRSILPRRPKSLSILPRDEDVSMLFVSYGEVTEEYLLLLYMQRITDSYSAILSRVGSPMAIKQTISNLESKNIRYLLLREGWDKILESVSYGTDKFVISPYLYYGFYPLSPYRNGNLVYKPLVEYILNHYKVFNSDNNYIVYRRITP